MLYKRNLIPALILALHCYQVIKVCISSFSKITQFLPWIFSSCTNNIKSGNFNPLSHVRSYAPPEKVMFSALVSNTQNCLLFMWFLHNRFSKRRRKYWIKEYFHHQSQKMIKKAVLLGISMCPKPSIDFSPLVVSAPAREMWFSLHDGANDAIFLQILLKPSTTMTSPHPDPHFLENFFLSFTEN